jgi:hypothetical protein
MSLRFLARCWLLLLTLALHPLAWAHKPSDSYLTLLADTQSTVIKVRWDIALRDLDYVLALDRDGNGELTWGEVKQRSAEITTLAMSRLSLSTNSQPCTWGATGPLMLETHSDGTYAVLSLEAACTTLAQGVAVKYGLFFDVDPTHRGLLQWSAPGATTPQALIFGTESAEQTLAATPANVWETLRQYVLDGVWHIWIGYDHILFLLALLLPAVLVRRHGQWAGAPALGGASKEVLKVVTAFTLAHSITLSLAALELVALPSRLVESAIAASVVLAALNNLRGTLENRRWIMAFVFGLIHGFGFASVLADLGLPQNALVIALVGFNVGVELGQLAIVAVFLPLAFAVRNTRFYQVGVLKGGSLAVAVLAAWWLVERMFDL